MCLTMLMAFRNVTLKTILCYCNNNNCLSSSNNYKPYRSCSKTWHRSSKQLSVCSSL